MLSMTNKILLCFIIKRMYCVRLLDDKYFLPNNTDLNCISYPLFYAKLDTLGICLPKSFYALDCRRSEQFYY